MVNAFGNVNTTESFPLFPIVIHCNKTLLLRIEVVIKSYSIIKKKGALNG